MHTVKPRQNGCLSETQWFVALRHATPDDAHPCLWIAEHLPDPLRSVDCQLAIACPLFEGHSNEVCLSTDRRLSHHGSRERAFARGYRSRLSYLPNSATRPRAVADGIAPALYTTRRGECKVHSAPERRRVRVCTSNRGQVVDRNVSEEFAGTVGTLGRLELERLGGFKR